MLNSTLDPEALEAATKAAYESMISQAREQVRRRQTNIADLPQLIERIHGESETAQVLIFGSFLEDRFRSAIEENLQNMDDPDAVDRLFGGFGPLSSFSSRILLAYHLGWISKRLRSKLDSFRKLRNEFAHNAYRVSFTDHAIDALIRKVSAGDREVVERMHKAGAAASPDADFAKRTLNANQWVLCYFASLAARAVEEVRVYAVALEFHVGQEDLLRAVRDVRRDDDEPTALAKTILQTYARGQVASS